MSEGRQTVHVAGQEVTLNIPDDSMVTGVVLVATYQRIHDDGNIGAGTSWAHSSIPAVQAVGMIRLAQIEIERSALNYD